MKVNDFQKRPKSGKQNNRDSKSKPSVIKTEETQLETNTNQNKNTNPNISGDKIIESEEENYTQSNLMNKSKSSIEKLDFLDSLAKGSRRDSFLNLLDEEAHRIDKINTQKQKLHQINLKENDIEGLYEWKTLFNNSKPMSSYTRINYKKPTITEEIELNKLKSPKVLVDLPDDKMLYFFGKNAFGDNNGGDKKKKDKNKKGATFRNSNANNNNVSTLSNVNKSNAKHLGSSKILKTNREDKDKVKEKDKDKERNNKNTENNKAHNYIKPMSIYGQFNPEDTFYFSNTFSDYYKEDLKSFSNKMPILKAKVKTNSKRLKKTMTKQRIKSSNKEKILYDTIMNDPLVLRKQDLIISAERRNPVPLMKSIYKQENPDAVEIKEHVKKYFNTMKPFGNDDGTTDYTKNDRWRLSREIAKIRTGKNDEENKNENGNEYYTGKGKKRKLILSYYDINDPAIKLFNNLHLDENQINNNSFEFKNDGTNSSYNIKFEVINKSFEQNNKSNQNSSRKLKKEEKKEIINYKLKQRPRTGFKQSRTLNILNNEKVKRPPSSKRPHSSLTRRKYSLSGNKIFDLKDYNELYKDYMPSNRFPVKTNSKVSNTSYNRINQMLKERQLSRKLLSNMNDKYYYFITQPTISSNHPYETLNSTENGKSTVKTNEKRRARPKTATGARSNSKMGINLDNKSIHSKDSQQKCNYLYFNNCINMSHELPKNNDIQFKGYYGPANCFNKLAGKFYSSSVNVHVKNKRNKKKQILNTYYGKYNDDFQKANNMKKYDEIF